MSEAAHQANPGVPLGQTQTQTQTQTQQQVTLGSAATTTQSRGGGGGGVGGAGQTHPERVVSAGVSAGVAGRGVGHEEAQRRSFQHQAQIAHQQKLEIEYTQRIIGQQQLALLQGQRHQQALYSLHLNMMKAKQAQQLAAAQQLSQTSSQTTFQVSQHNQTVDLDQSSSPSRSQSISPSLQ